MPLIFGAIAPHGYQALPELTPKHEVGLLTRAAMGDLGRRLEGLSPETIVILTPHGIRIDGTMCISVSERAEGSLGADMAVDFAVDQALAERIAADSTHAGVPVARCIYGASSGPASCIPLDWGSIIPLRYMGDGYTPKPDVVVICPSRSLSRHQMVTFGEVVGRAAETSSRRIALIASADQAHAHAADGPYGFNPAARDYDQRMGDAVRANDLLSLLSLSDEVVDAAKPDSLWQTLILAGALNVRPLRGELLSYEVANYFGMLCAAYETVTNR